MQLRVVKAQILENDHSQSSAEQGEHDAMREAEINDYARQLLDAHGAQAVVEAAQMALYFEQQGENEQAQTWRQIEEALIASWSPMLR